ncbi:MAG: protein-L-isoaspartate(D-aspartate) O-methyltransferase [Saprospiraceae bacterium]
MENYHHRGRRRKLIEDLRQRGGIDERVLSVMANVPRHLFIEQAFEDRAYADEPLPISCEQTISQPTTVGLQSTYLQVLPRQKILEIGTGSGYQAAVLALLGGRVFTLERHEQLFQATRKRLRKLRFGQVRCYLRDGYGGLPEMAPFDRILVTAGAPEVPESLLGQLAPGGIMVVPVGTEEQRMLRLTKDLDGRLREEDLGAFRFVPFLAGIAHLEKSGKRPTFDNER